MENVPSVILLPQHVRVWQNNFTSHLVDPLLAMSVQDGASFVQWKSCASVNSAHISCSRCTLTPTLRFHAHPQATVPGFALTPGLLQKMGLFLGDGALYSFCFSIWAPSVFTAQHRFD